MKKYLITIVSKTTKKYLLDCYTSEDALIDATNYFLDNEDEMLYEEPEINSINISLELVKENDDNGFDEDFILID